MGPAYGGVCRDGAEDVVGNLLPGCRRRGARQVEQPRVMPSNARPAALIAWPESPAGFRDVDPVNLGRLWGRMVARRTGAPVIVGDWGRDENPNSGAGRAILPGAQLGL